MEQSNEEYIIISKQEESDSNGIYYRAKLVKNGVIQEGNASVPKNFRRSESQIGDIYKLKNGQKSKIKIDKSSKKKSWLVTPKFKDSDTSDDKVNDCQKKFCSIVSNCSCPKPQGGKVIKNLE